MAEESKLPPPSAAVMALEQLSLQVDIWIDPSNVDKFFEAMRPIFDKVTAEPECVYFEIFQDPDDLGHLSWVENWKASAAWVATVCLFFSLLVCVLVRDVVLME